MGRARRMPRIGRVAYRRRELPLVRRTLEEVFAHQFNADGSWPQWFMHPPYQSIQQADSHGDVCFMAGQGAL